MGKTRKTKKTPRSNLEITILKQGIRSKQVLSCSFFTMKDAYRPVEQYEKNLQRFLHQKKQLKGFETRIYTDDSGKEFALKAAKKDPTVSVYHFNFQPMRETVGHIGTFGTFVRFLPLFEAGLKTVWVTDVDVPSYYLDPSILSDAKRAKVDFCYRTFVCYDEPRFKVYARPYTILAGTMISFHTFPIELFNQYLHQLENPSKSLQHMFDKLNEQNTFLGKPYSNIPYGFDEIFTNGILYDYLIDHSLQCYILKDYEYAKNILKWNKFLTEEDLQVFLKYYKERSLSTFKQAKEIYREKLPLLGTKYASIVHMVKILDTFKTSFLKTFVKTGKELDEDLYKE